MLEVDATGEKDLNFKKGVRGVGIPLKETTPRKDRANLNSFDSTSILSQVARSAMNYFYGVISAIGYARAISRPA